MPRPLSQQNHGGNLLAVRVTALPCTSGSSTRPAIAVQQHTAYAAPCPRTTSPVLVGPPGFGGGKERKGKKGRGREGRKERKRRKGHFTPLQLCQHCSGHNSTTRRLLKVSLVPLDSLRCVLRVQQKPATGTHTRHFTHTFYSPRATPTRTTGHRGWQYHAGTSQPAAPAAGRPSTDGRGRGEGEEKGKERERAAPGRAQAGHTPSQRCHRRRPSGLFRPDCTTATPSKLLLMLTCWLCLVYALNTFAHITSTKGLMHGSGLQFDLFVDPQYCSGSMAGVLPVQFFVGAASTLWGAWQQRRGVAFHCTS